VARRVARPTRDLDVDFAATSRWPVQAVAGRWDAFASCWMPSASLFPNGSTRVCRRGTRDETSSNDSDALLDAFAQVVPARRR